MFISVIACNNSVAAVTSKLCWSLVEFEDKTRIKDVTREVSVFEFNEKLVEICPVGVVCKLVADMVSVADKTLFTILPVFVKEDCKWVWRLVRAIDKLDDCSSCGDGDIKRDNDDDNGDDNDDCDGVDSDVDEVVGVVDDGEVSVNDCSSGCDDFDDNDDGDGDDCKNDDGETVSVSVDGLDNGIAVVHSFVDCCAIVFVDVIITTVDNDSVFMSSVDRLTVINWSDDGGSVDVNDFDVVSDEVNDSDVDDGRVGSKRVEVYGVKAEDSNALDDETDCDKVVGDNVGCDAVGVDGAFTNKS